MNRKRVRVLKQAHEEAKPVVYWMSRDQRVKDNWALLFSQELAIEKGVPLAVVFCLVPGFLGATARHYGFMLRGLQELSRSLVERHIPFYLETGSPGQAIVDFVNRHGIGTLVTDFDPLRLKQEWKAGVVKRADITLYEVDAHNIVPCWLASPKQEYAARTLRPKLNRALPEFLEEFPTLIRHPFQWSAHSWHADWDRLMSKMDVDQTVSEVDWIQPGEPAAEQALKTFLAHGLPVYDKQRNDPTARGESGLSPYLHFGHLSPQRVALEARKADVAATARDAFLDELIVRRELSDNFCFYNPRYDSFDGFPNWAKRTLDEHRGDPREHVYNLDELEKAQTHDNLWNAAQREMVRRGKMHGYMRMYWAKKILEWTESPESALDLAIHLNNRYELDGRDPNGYAGIAWSIGGVHDRAWPSRRVFGKIRYMSYQGCKSKFNVDRYVERFSQEPG